MRETRWQHWAQRWEAFWFAPSATYNLGLFRMIAAFTMFIMYSLRLADFDFFFGQDSFLPGDAGWKLLPANMIPPLHWFPTDTLTLYWLHWVYIVGLGLLALGVIGQWLTFALFALQVGFIQQNFAIAYGADLIAIHWLLYLSLTRHNEYFNILHLFRYRSSSKVKMHGGATTVGIRFIQIQLAVIYAFSGVEKLKGGPWWEGTAVWVTLTNMDLVDYDFSFLAQLPLLAFLASFLPLVWEIYFPFLVANLRWRPWALVFGLGFHIMIGWIMHLPYFSLLMVSAYLLYLPDLSSKISHYFLRLAGRSDAVTYS